MQQKEDYFHLWMIAGLIGVYTRDIYSFLAKVSGISTFYIWQMAAQVFVSPEEISTFWGNVLGLLTDSLIGASVGFVFGLFVEWRGIKYYLLKGWGIGLISWFLFFGVAYHNLPQMSQMAPQKSVPSISAFVGHSVFGIATAYSYMILMRRATHRKTSTASSANNHFWKGSIFGVMGSWFFRGSPARKRTYKISRYVKSKGKI